MLVPEAERVILSCMIDPQHEELRSLLQKNLRIAQENNKILLSLQRAQRRARLVRLIYWCSIAVAIIALYYFLQPRLEAIGELYGSLLGFADMLENLRPGAPR
jgi:hypothetical protein